jgi:hypothetical protein
LLARVPLLPQRQRCDRRGRLSSESFRRKSTSSTTDKDAPTFTSGKADGKVFRLADFHGKGVVMRFLHASGPGACPLHADRVAETQKMINHTPMNDRIQFISISTDLEHKTLKILRGYGPAHGLDGATHLALHADGASEYRWWQGSKARPTFSASALVGVADAVSLVMPDKVTCIFIAATMIAALPIARRAVAAARAGTAFSIEPLMGIAAAGAITIGAAEEEVVVLFLIGELLEGYAAGRAQVGISILADIVPKTARIEEGNAVREVGSGTDVALETAGAAILNSNVMDVSRLVLMLRQSMAVIHQNTVVALGSQGVLMIMTIVASPACGPPFSLLPALRCCSRSTSSACCATVSNHMIDKKPVANPRDNIIRQESLFMLVALLLVGASFYFPTLVRMGEQSNHPRPAPSENSSKRSTP